MAYETGGISIAIETVSEKTIQKLDKIISLLGKMDVSLQKPISSLNRFARIKVDNLVKNLDTISKLDFSSLANAFKPIENIDTKKLSSVNRQINNLTKINFDKVNFRKLYEQVTTLNRIFDPFIQKIQNAEPSLRAFSNALDLGEVNAQLMIAEAKVNAINSKAQSRKILDDVKIEKANLQLEKTKKRIDEINEKAEKTKNKFNQIFSIGRIYFWLNYTKRIANVFVQWINSAIAFDETLNKFQVSFGTFTKEATNFVNEITYAFNLSKQSVMDYMSTFNNMLSALGGIDDYTSYQLSETLTRMAIDYASLFNVSVNTAMQQFQQVLSGQIRSIRSTSGYDVSEQTIFTLYQELGGTKTMRQLSQLEKRLLRILAVQKQMSETGAVGDFSKTLDTSANMLKQIAETFQEIGRWLGTLLMQYIRPIIQATLTISIVLREILKSVAILGGYTDKVFEEGSGFEGLTENLEKANDEIDELTGKLLSFDKFEVLKSDENVVGGDLDKITSSLAKYTTSLKDIQSTSSKIAEDILTFLGYEVQINKETGEINYKLKDGYTTIEKMKNLVESIAIVISLPYLFKLANYLLDIATGVKSINYQLLLNIKTLKMLSLSTFIYGLFSLITQWKEMNLQLKMTYILLTLVVGTFTIISNFDKIITFLTKLANVIKLLGNALGRTTIGFGVFLAGLTALILIVSKWDNMNSFQRIIGVLGALTVALLGGAIALGAFHSAWSLGLATAGIVAGIMAVVSALKTTKEEIRDLKYTGIGMYANGGFPNEGQLFVANEKGAELVGNIGGRTAVANNDMIVSAIENASYRGFTRAMKENPTNNTNKLIIEGRNINNSAFARAIMPSLKVESGRSSG